MPKMDKPKLPLAYFDGTDIAEGRELISPHGMNLIKSAITTYGRDYATRFIQFMAGKNLIKQEDADPDFEYWLNEFEKEVYGTFQSNS